MTTLRELAWSRRASRARRLMLRHATPEVPGEDYAARLRRAIARRSWWDPPPAAGVKPSVKGRRRAW